MIPAEPASSTPVNRQRHRVGRVWRALGERRVLTMLLLGFSSGLPFMLTGNTLGGWLATQHIGLGAIGALSWVGLAYSLKFLWAPVIDRVGFPALGALGRRRGWMLAAQVLVGGGLAAMALAGPQGGLAAFAALALVVAFASATQDIVLDAWRIEIAETPDELGLLTAAYQIGYRVALLFTMAWILILADHIGWPMSYGLSAALMAVGIGATFMAEEPARADAVMEAKSDAAPLWTARGFADAVAGPFIAFFKAHGLFGLVTLLTITLFHLSDYLRGPVTLPFYRAAGYSLTDVGAIRTTIGLWCTVAGVASGGLSSVRQGVFRTLVIGAALQPIGIGAFALVALHGAPDLRLFAMVNAMDDFAIGFSGVALVAYMSSLTNLGYVASQYAVMSSALAWTGKTLKGFSGFVVQGLQQGRDLMHAYALFYLGVAALGLPAIGLCFVLAHAAKRRAGALTPASSL
ncbi:MAG TPA: MFS transporter [Caulobacteraceae bacterium]|nr:MFS transporter [Caulobacteraceae bacterium]